MSSLTFPAAAPGPALDSPAWNSPALPAKVSAGGDPIKIREAAQQFEALLLNQLLQTANEDGGWLGSGDDASSACATSLAQQQLATLMARNGGIGMGSLIAQGLATAGGAADSR